MMKTMSLIWVLAAGAAVVACKPTPRTAEHADGTAAHKEEITAPPAAAAQPEETAQPPAEEQPTPRQEVGLLEVSVTRQDYNRLRPWEKHNANNGHYMGVYLGNGRVLAPGNAARAATYVELSLPDGSHTAPARVVKYDDELNLALLTVEHPEDAELFAGMSELSVGEPLHLNDRAEVCALLRGMEPARVEAEVESADDEDAEDLPRLELRTDKPLPQGNAMGLPIVKDGKLVALTERYSSQEQILTCINAEFISRFLDESTIEGESVPVLGLLFAELDDPVFSKYLKLNPKQGGVYVSKVLPGSSAANAGVRQGDVLISIDGLELDKLGRCQHPIYGLIGARQTIRSLKPVGQHITLGISRNGEIKELSLPLNRDALSKRLLGKERPGVAPRYIVWGGMLFQPLTETYLDALQDSARSLPLPFLQVRDRESELQNEGYQEVVALTLVVPTPATLGYDGLGFCMVEQVNGQQVSSFARFAQLLDAPTDDGIVELTINRPPYRIYLDRQIVESSNDAIRRRAIPRLRQMGQETTTHLPLTIDE